MDKREIFLHTLKGEMEERGSTKIKKYKEVESAIDVYGSKKITAAEIKEALEKAWKVRK